MRRGGEAKGLKSRPGRGNLTWTMNGNKISHLKSISSRKAKVEYSEKKDPRRFEQEGRGRSLLKQEGGI